MPANATDIVSVVDAAFALSIDGAEFDAEGVPANDIAREVARCIAAGADWCAELADKPLVDRTATFTAPRPVPASCPIRLPSPYVKSITSIRYWRTTQALREDPAGTVMVGPSDPAQPSDDPIGRLEVVDRHYTAVWPPAAGWPEVLWENGVRSGFRVVYVEGFDDDALESEDGIAKAVTMAAGMFYEGAQEEDYSATVRALLQPFVDGRWSL